MQSEKSTPTGPLEGIRVLELSHILVGPTATMLLADMGMEVIKVEAIQRVDGLRGSRIPLGEEKAYERSPLFNTINRNKYGLTLNLKNQRGVGIFKDLVKISDIVVSNFAPRVMRDLGIEYLTLKEVNPAIIVICASGFGDAGPLRNFTAYAFTIEDMAGLTDLTGFRNGPAMIAGATFGDQVPGMYVALAAVMAVRQRCKTGKGQYIDLSMFETMSLMAAESILEYAVNGRILSRDGNGHPYMAPHGCYPTKDEGKWVTIAVASQEQWKSFCQAIEEPCLEENERFADPLSRWTNRDELDRIVEEWTVKHGHREVMEILQGVGVAAGGVLDGEELSKDIHLKERGFLQAVPRAYVGTHSYPGPFIRFSKTPTRIRMPAPCLGEHNIYVLQHLLGMSKEEIDELAKEAIIGNEIAQTLQVRV